MLARLSLYWGETLVSELRLPNMCVGEISVKLGSKDIPFKVRRKKNELILEFREIVTIKTDQTLKISIG